jgi:hypothetical protein
MPFGNPTPQQSELVVGQPIQLGLISEAAKTVRIVIPGSSKSQRAGFGDCLVLFARSAADADAADNLVATLQRNASREDHDSTVIGRVNPEELTAGLAVFREILGRNVEGAGGPGLVDRDVDAANPSFIHSHVGDQIAARIHHGDVHGLSNFLRLFLSGGNDSASVG